VKTRFRLLVEGWRFISHSYAMVNQFQLLELLRCGSAAVAHRDLPLPDKRWKSVAGLLRPEDETRLKSIPAPAEDQEFDAVYRICFPYDLSSSAEASRTCVFGTAEFADVPDDYMADRTPLAVAHRQSNSIVVTPSQWSRGGFIQSGADPSRVVVVPHGVDPEIFRPVDAAKKRILRRRLRWPDEFMFLNVGAVTGNKGIERLLRAFAAVLEKHPKSWLVLKGNDALFGSRRLLQKLFNGMEKAEAEIVKPRVRYIGRDLPIDVLAALYQASDAYVSPYIAEGFNLPALEAIACGLPLICTAGGPTDEFIDPAFALQIRSSKVVAPSPFGKPGSALKPSTGHLIELMNRVIEDSQFVNKAHVVGPEWVAGAYTWRHVVQRLFDVLHGSPRSQ
jgi:glycosyltransferase involved in cell wall biosynthesis